MSDDEIEVVGDRPAGPAVTSRNAAAVAFFRSQFGRKEQKQSESSGNPSAVGGRQEASENEQGPKKKKQKRESLVVVPPDTVSHARAMEFINKYGEKHHLRIASSSQYKGYIHCVPCKKPIKANYNCVMDHIGEASDGVLKGGKLGRKHMKKLKKHVEAQERNEQWKLYASLSQVPGMSNDSKLCTGFGICITQGALINVTVQARLPWPPKNKCGDSAFSRPSRKLAYLSTVLNISKASSATAFLGV
jgi:hypothetical protein